MTLSPDDIVNFEFKTTRRGYEPDAVDALLDRVADQIEATQSELLELRNRLADAEARVQDALVTESTLTRTLVAAQATAERTIADAEAEAQRTVEEAREQAADVRAAAEREAAEQLDRAASEAARAVAEGQARREELIASVAELRHVEQHHRQHLRDHLEASLAMLDQVEPVPPPSELPGAPAPDGTGAALDAPTTAETERAAGSVSPDQPLPPDAQDAPVPEAHDVETAEAVEAASAEHIWDAWNVDDREEPEPPVGAGAPPPPPPPSETPADPWTATPERSTPPGDAQGASDAADEEPDDQPLFGGGAADAGDETEDGAADDTGGGRPDLTVRVRDEP